jgi:hypothetical protein
MEERFDVARDYLQLLRRGSIERRLPVADHPGWRRAIRAKARTDELRVRTWSRPEEVRVFAVLSDWTLSAEDRERLARRLEWLRED